ncbi:unnamed protein product [Symbiodinium sp. CCMP2592]|nr:unnamed protein product [Symbiodinium sp. CCMP2592]
MYRELMRSELIEWFDQMPQDRQAKRARLVMEAMEETIQDKEKTIQDKERTVQVQSELTEMHKREKLRLLEELSRVKALYATRPLLELGLSRYLENNPMLAGSTWTSLSQAFTTKHIYTASHDLQPWAKRKLERINKMFKWHVVEEDYFDHCLWRVCRMMTGKFGLTRTASF